MLIKNSTKNIIITNNAIEALTLRQKILGLIFYNKPTAMIFHTRFGIHTFFMRFPIDVIIIDKKNQIYTFKKNLKPFRIFFWNPLYSRVIELPPDSIMASGTEIGDFIDIIC